MNRSAIRLRLFFLQSRAFECASRCKEFSRRETYFEQHTEMPGPLHAPRARVGIMFFCELRALVLLRKNQHHDNTNLYETFDLSFPLPLFMRRGEGNVPMTSFSRNVASCAVYLYTTFFGETPFTTLSHPFLNCFQNQFPFYLVCSPQFQFKNFSSGQAIYLDLAT